MLVTNIERQKRNPQRVNVYLDDEFAFGVHIDVLAVLGLKKGDNLSKEAIENILTKEEFSLAKNYALRSLSHRRRTEKELHSKLIQKEFNPRTVDAVIAHLRELGLLNDVEFTKAFVHDVQLRKPSGKNLLQQKLRLKGVAPSIITTVLSEEVSDKQEESLAMEEAKKVIKRYRTSRKVVEPQKQQQRLAQHLARRGFSWTTIMPVIKNVFGSRQSGGAS